MTTGETDRVKERFLRSPTYRCTHGGGGLRMFKRDRGQDKRFKGEGESAGRMF